MDYEINITEMLPDEYIQKFGMTREQFNNSRVKDLLEAMVYSYLELTHEKSLKLMKEHSLTYAEAESIVRKGVNEAILNKGLF